VTKCYTNLRSNSYGSIYSMNHNYYYLSIFDGKIYAIFFNNNSQKYISKLDVKKCDQNDQCRLMTELTVHRNH
jgi:hypothetical protein